MQLYNCSLKNKSFNPRTWEAEAEAEGEEISVSSISACLQSKLQSYMEKPCLKTSTPPQKNQETKGKVLSD